MELLYYPDPRLREIARPVGEVDDDLETTIRDMFNLMYETRGVGLAAPQVGIGRRLVVANLTCDPEQADKEEVFIDLEVLERSSETIKEEEACLSLPGLHAEIPRAKGVKIRYRNLKGEAVEREATEFEARMFLHENDHLDGILILDLLTTADRARWAPTLKEMEAEFKTNPKRRYSATGEGL